jgi:PadR family transcriptional regulator, regulatory protein AphA
METILFEKDGVSYLECQPVGSLLASERDVLDLLAACMENGTNRILIPIDCLPDEFFDLKTGLAGVVLQKFVNYSVRAAAVIPAERVGQGRFAEMVLETNRGSQFRVFESRESAEHWLIEKLRLGYLVHPS